MMVCEPRLKFLAPHRLQTVFVSVFFCAFHNILTSATLAVEAQFKGLVLPRTDRVELLVW